MNSELQELLNNISLMLVMTSPGDEQGIELLRALCDDARTLAAKDGHARLVAAVDFLNARTTSSDFLSDIQTFITAALQYASDAGIVRFPHESIESSAVTTALLDVTFLAEFIETHVPQLEEVEAAIVDLQQGRSDEEKCETFLKRYLHNLKGDSGSIGLVDIELVCHALEDMLCTQSPSGLATELLEFKEWAVRMLRELAAGAAPSESGTSFLMTLRSAPEKKQPDVVPAPPQPTTSDREYQLSGEPEILLEFAAEAEEHLSNLEAVILNSEGAFSKESVDTIFRAVHSLKGGSGYFSLDETIRSSHILENFLSEARDGKREMDGKLNALLLVYVDLQKEVLARARRAAASGGRMERSAASDDFLRSLDAYGSRKQSQEVAPAPAPTAKTSSEAKGAKLDVKDFVKVDTARLDHLIDSIGEMVIYSSMLVRHCRELLGSNEGVMDTTHRVEKFSRDLQDIGMSMRLVPIKGLFQKMSRLVWDTSKKLGKNIQFEMNGEDTELDRNLIDKLADPLMHMVRNSLDHGIETPQERLQAGKSEVGTVTLAAFHSGGSIHIQIMDDGRGLNSEKLLAKAIERGIVQPGQKLAESDIFQLIFAPGFSTAAVVTDISGRGVGMDVVRRNVESLRGRIHIQSEVGKGSTFTIELPLTLAIIDGIQIRVGDEYFIVPSLSIVEFVRPKAEMITNALDIGETFHFRGKYLPIFHLGRLYDVAADCVHPQDGTVVVVENGHELVALVVDEVLGQYSTVIKSLGPAFEDGRGLAGCAIMPSGDVALILDIRSLVSLARDVYRHKELAGELSASTQ